MNGSGKFAISEAGIEDAAGMLSIQAEKLLPKLEGEENKPHPDGFLVYAVSESELRGIITNKEKHIVLVSRYHGELDGYVLSYDLAEWMALKPKWENEIKVGPEIRKKILGGRTLYLRHIARMKQSAGEGRDLEYALFEKAKGRYDRIVCEILETPIMNLISINLHESVGFARVGEIKDEKGLIWGLYLKEL
ncbi:MAG: hypothetical protein WC488_01340 [Candidatus Micrarchaeia archaeon]